MQLPLPASAQRIFEQRNGAALVAGFGLIAPHVLVQVGQAVYTFWGFRGPAKPRDDDAEVGGDDGDMDMKRRKGRDFKL